MRKSTALLASSALLALSGALAAITIQACSVSNQTAPGGPVGDQDGGDGAVNPVAFTFKPTGCSYQVETLATWALTDVALDDGAAVTDMTGGAPIRVRLGLGGTTTVGKAGYPDPTTTAVVTWETTAANHAAQVRIGTDPTSMTDVHTGFAWTTPPPQIGIGATEPPTYLHEVHICGLQPGTTYYYQAGGGTAAANVFSATQSFTTVPTTGSVSFGFSGDSRDRVTTLTQVQARMRDAAVNFQVYSGDFVDIGTSEQLYSAAFDAIWKDPSDNTKFLTLGQQMIVAIAGNHENDAARFFSNFPLPAEGTYAKTYASFNAGSAHFMLIDDEQIALGAPQSDEAVAQLAWIDQDLAAANQDRTAHPFIVAISHRGMYSTSNHATDGDVLYVRQVLGALYDKYSVDVALNGHDHEYERTHAVKANAVVPDGQGTVYIINGGAGSDPYAVGTAPATYRAMQTTFTDGKYIGTYGVATLTANTLTLKSYGMKPSGTRVADDDVIDTVELTH